MNKKHLTERDICTKFITPALAEAGWDIKTQMLEEWGFTDGRIIVQGDLTTRGTRKRADYVLFYKSYMVAIIEAKDNKHSVGAGMQQALNYADILHIPFVFASNGDAFIFHDKTETGPDREKEIGLNEFPSPEKLWQKYVAFKGLEEHVEIIEAENHVDESGKKPRYYQQIAINETLEAIAQGQQRLLLVMATGTGKTYTAFQIVWKLWKARKKKRILFLADRNALVTQTKNGDFRPFPSDIVHVIKNRKTDPSYQIYFALYQQLVGSETREAIYENFSKDFFDLIIIDECHRGSASEASLWHDILSYFSAATHIGLTATPKETKDISNISYFGEPVYTYSLKQGIADGFLAPYKVVRISMDKDEGWRPSQGMKDKYGWEIEDRIYNLKDFDRKLVLDQRTQQVAQKITEYLKKTNRFAKTIVFCTDIDHAERMRNALIRENADLVDKHENYIMKITGDDADGKRELWAFTSVEERFPVIATTSKLLTTGVDTKMVKLIALDANIGSMTEFKQIVGRGTRIREEEGKTHFTIMDFKKVTNHFADPDFDGEPVAVKAIDVSENLAQALEDSSADSHIDETQESHLGGQTPGQPTRPNPFDDLPDAPTKYYVHDVEVSVVNERVQYYGADGALITESIKDYTRSNAQKAFDSIDDFLRFWSDGEKKEVIMKELAEKGILYEALKEEVDLDMDPFDLIAHVAFDQPPLSRQERANSVKKRNYFGQYSGKAREVIEALLSKYADEGIESLEASEILKVKPLNQLGTPVEIVKAFGKKKDFEQMIKELGEEIYKSA